MRWPGLLAAALLAGCVAGPGTPDGPAPQEPGCRPWEGSSPDRLVFVDADDVADGHRDLDGDGGFDLGEPVRLASTDTTAVAELHDVNGDGMLDAVFDTDCSGFPDAFIPAGQNSSLALTMADVTSDGRLDWTYASSGSGAPDSYYDPECNGGRGCAGFIDP